MNVPKHWQLLPIWKGYGSPFHPLTPKRTPDAQAAIQRDDEGHIGRELDFQIWRSKHISTCHEALLWMRQIGRASK